MDLLAYVAHAPQPRRLLKGGREAPLFNERTLREHCAHRRHSHMSGNVEVPHMDLPAYRIKPVTLLLSYKRRGGSAYR
jgi:hypothetical protein